MCKSLILLAIFLQVFQNLTPTHSACIFLDDCPVAVKYIEKRRNNPETVNILQSAHCGFGTKNGRREAKISCEKVPAFPEPPSGCIPFTQCPAAVRLIETRAYDPKVIELLKSAECGDSETKDMILCNKVEQLSNKTSRKIKLLPRLENCGLQMPIPKIYGGKIAELDDFTWIALLKYKNRTGHIQYGCHGSLVSNKYVVTAAHCLKTASQTKLGNLHSVVLGEYDIRTDVDCVHEQYGGDCNDPVQEFSIDSVRIHEDFESKGAMSDIALIRLNGSATFTNFVKPICLPLKLTPLQKHEPLWIAGWGKIENRTMSNVKLKAQIYSLSKEDCERNMNYSPDDTQLCAGSDNGADTCRGDSGGPLMVQRALKNEYKTFLVGVVSFGTRCGTRSAIYTKMSKFTDWILDNLES